MMRNPALVALIAIIATLTAACAGNETDGPRMRLDINNTYAAPIEVMSLTEQTIVDTLTVHDDGTYLMRLDSLRPDIYRLRVGQEYLDIVVEQPRNINIVARVNHCAEATTDHEQTRLLWKIEAFKQRLNGVETMLKQRLNAAETADSINSIAAAMNKLLKEARAEADALMTEADTSIVALAVLNLSVGNQRVYDPIDYSTLYMRTLERLRMRYPDNKLMTAMEREMRDIDLEARFRRTYAKGKACPRMAYVDQFGQQRSTDEMAGQRYVVFFSTDSTQQVKQVWQTIAQLRHRGKKIIALMPEAVDREPKINTIYGTKVNSAAMAELQKLQPVVWAVSDEGQIERMATEATMRDMSGEW